VFAAGGSYPAAPAPGGGKFLKGNGRMQVDAVMSQPVITISPQAAITEAAALMRRHDIGALPVVTGGRLVGILTDRDIVLRAVASPGGDVVAEVGAAMSADPATCRAGDDIIGAAVRMSDEQVRRLPVTDPAGRLVGLLSLGDIAENVSEELAGQTLGEICEARRRRHRAFRT